MSTWEVRVRDSLEIPPPPEGATAEEALAYIETMAAGALGDGYGRMHYRTDKVRVNVTLRRPKTTAVPIYVSTVEQKRLFEATS